MPVSDDHEKAKLENEDILDQHDEAMVGEKADNDYVDVLETVVIEQE